MDSTVKQMLEGFRFSVENYASTLGPDNEKLAEARKIIDSLYEKAEQGADVAAMSSDPNFARIGMLIGELASEEPAAAPPSMETPSAETSGETAAGGVPPASVPASGYHMAYDSMDPATREKQAPFYQRIFEIEEEAENAIAFNTMLEEDGVLLEMSRQPLLQTAEETLQQAAEVHSPTVDHQQELAARVYGEVKTLEELEYQGTKMAEFSNVEHQWDAQYLHVIGLLPACAQAIESFGPTEENVEKLKRSHRFMADFMGITWEEVFKDRRYLLFWNRVFWPKVPPEKRKKYGVNSAEGWRDLLKKEFYDPFVKEEPPVEPLPDRSRIRFWRNEYSSFQTLELLEKPPRPQVELEGPPMFDDR
ncbi:MAG: hypothetical protein GF388_11030 [Candidatus Aegiribacteria sp.]|nr:hypothetical protein [Candidatus Aegiribacteria sp.]MBD3295532.1 hypothetical protein [Candidatus Fermentibacteria bacterium]